MKTLIRTVVAIASLTLQASVVLAQTTTGSLSGQVVDRTDLPVPGVTVTVQSPSLQGVKTTTTSEHGDYVVPFLPPGDYVVTFALSGFETVQAQVRLTVASNEPLNVTLDVAGVTADVSVTAPAKTDFTQTSTIATSFQAAVIDTLPVARDLGGAVLLAPGTTDNGPGGNIMIAGAPSFENLFLINGVVVNETLRGVALPLYIEDAIEETKTSVGGISAEYGRFSGGVVNMTTKSGGNRFSGSYRTTFTNDHWRALNPIEKTLPVDPRARAVVPAFEGTLGGPILKDRLWFFGAGRYQNNTIKRTTPFTNTTYDYGEKERRMEAKLTYTPFTGQTLRFAYENTNLKIHNRNFSDVLDTASLFDREDPQHLISLNYTALLASSVFLEGQYSQRGYSLIGSGSRFDDLVKGTMIQDRSRSNIRWNSPTFCAICGAPPGSLNEEKRDNRDILVKATYFLSTGAVGSHTVVGGFDAFDNQRTANTYGTGSGYRVQATSTIIQSASGGGAVLYPVLDANTRIVWNPLVAASRGGHLKVYSGFANDTWRLGSRMTANVGVRYDRNDDTDQGGNKFASDAAVSPRLALTVDPTGTSNWVLATGFGRYVGDVAQGISDGASAAGRTATYTYDYLGPAVNVGLNGTSPNLVPTATALPRLFDWFFANGGTNRALRQAPTIPGVNTRMDARLSSPHADEFTIGASRKLGSKGLVRVDGIIRAYRDFYSVKRDLSTGRVLDSAGRPYDLSVVVNTDAAKRNYRGLLSQATYRFSPTLDVGGNYTLSSSRGNYAGEDTGGPATLDLLDYPQYRRESWNYPTGYLNSDQRHKVRAWMSWRVPMAERWGRLNVALLERADSGYAYSANATVTVTPYVANPGYLTPPASLNYYFGGRGAYSTEPVSRTDMALNYTFRLKVRGSSPELFLRSVFVNLFNQAAVTTENSTVLTSDNSSALQPFNPFTQTPVEGTHWMKGPSFGQPVGASSYQASRSVNVAVGVRF